MTTCSSCSSEIKSALDVGGEHGCRACSSVYFTCRSCAPSAPSHLLCDGAGGHRRVAPPSEWCNPCSCYWLSCSGDHPPRSVEEQLRGFKEQWLRLFGDDEVREQRDRFRGYRITLG